MSHPAPFFPVQLDDYYTDEKAGARAGPSAAPSRHVPSQIYTGVGPSQTHSFSSLPHPPHSGRVYPNVLPYNPDLLVSGQHWPSPAYTRPRGLRIVHVLKPWLPVIMYGATTFAFLLAIAFWKDEVFERLDELSHYLRADEQFGYAVMFSLIFLTTIPPIPLYSTFITLSGYTFGAWTGAFISYWAALAGAIFVFLVSRLLLQETITRWLQSTCTIQQVVRTIEKRPKLLFLIRLAPYPYNVMNCLLAASPTLTFKTYAICTALSLFKVIIHTALGASIHSFKDTTMKSDEDNNASYVARIWTGVGIVLCIAIIIYLGVVARRAIEDECDGEGTQEERRVFLASDIERDGDMREVTAVALGASPPSRAGLAPTTSSGGEVVRSTNA